MKGGVPQVTPEQVKRIITLHQNGYGQNAIARMLNINPGSVNHYLKKEREKAGQYFNIELYYRNNATI